MEPAEDDDEVSQKCEWCGRPVSSGTWDEYCSFRCTAAGRHRMFLVLAVLSPVIQILMALVLVLMGIGLSTDVFMRPTFTGPLLILTATSAFFIYGAYVGGVMRRGM